MYKESLRNGRNVQRELIYFCFIAQLTSSVSRSTNEKCSVNEDKIFHLS